MALQEKNLGQDMRKEIVILDMQEIRQCVRSILDSAAGRESCHGGIFLDNVTYHRDPRLTFALGAPRDVTQLWNQWNEWITEQSSSIAYIPPEEILTALMGDKSKVDSWAVGCLLIQLFNYGKPLRLRRHWRYASGIEHFDVKKPEILDRLRQFYTDVGQERGLNVGPEIASVLSKSEDTNDAVKIPYACEDFLVHCLDPDPAQRWTLDRLRNHAFVELPLSLKELLAKDEEYYKTLPFIDNFTLTNVRLHPHLASSTTCTVYVADSPDLGGHRHQPVEVWKFQLLNEAVDRELYTRAYGKLLNVLALDNSNDESTRQHAGFYRIRALQLGNQNIARHFGCQFVPQPNSYSMPEFQVFSEHCAGRRDQSPYHYELLRLRFTGGNLQQASAFHLPINIIQIWTAEVLRGMDFLHKHGIVHRNINSAIIFFSEPSFKGTVKIGGFHNMRQLDGDKTQKHEVSARHGQDGRFVPPEINSPDYTVNVGRKSDIWSVGCVVLHLVTGKPPVYTGQSGRAIDTEMAVVYRLNNQKQGPEIPDWVPASVRAFIAKCLQFDPADRPSAAGLLQEDHSALAVDEAALVEYHNHRAGEALPQDVSAHWTQNN